MLFRSSDFIPFVRDRHLWYIDEVQPPDLAAVARPPAKLSSTELWHLRLGHISPAYLRHMKLPDLPQVRAFTCHTCQEAKMRHASKAGPSSSRASQPFELIHADTAGTTHHKSIHGEEYYTVFYCDCTGYRKTFCHVHRTAASLPKFSRCSRNLLLL